MVCQVPETLVNSSFQEQGYQCAERFAELLRAKAIELAMIRNREGTLSYQLIEKMAKEARINFEDVSKMEVRGSIAAIRQEVKKQNIEG
jgi:hypothetical protein